MGIFSREQLNVLTADLDLFRPSGLNDASRIDLTDGGPFVAIDTRSPYEIDDAIRVRRQRSGGFIVQAAIADGAQIPTDSDIVTAALKAKESTYRGKRCVNSMLPEVAIRQLELAPSRAPQRALVVETQFDRDALPKGDVSVYPATVKAEAFRQAEFATRYLRREGPRAPIAQFVEAFRSHRSDLQYELPEALGGTQSNVIFGGRLLQDYMVLTNHAFTQHSLQRSVPVLCRRYPDIPAIWGHGSAPSDPSLRLLGENHTEGFTPGIPYARATSPLHEGASLANHLLFGAYMADADQAELTELASRMQRELEAV
ncbi:MAG TPA: RNB domain-containing ribonuclease [Candidatus Saccharimonadales bacterium]|nr:RNB domain-containing ribonuclease [Candidatus Saccharimonadales bacterium]